MDANEDDSSLVAACLRGEVAAQRRLFRREYPRVNATIFRLVGRHRDSEDLVQEAFVEVFRSLAHFRGEARLSTWIDRIAVRVAMRWFGARRPPAAQLELVPEPAAQTAAADRRADARAGLERLYAVLATLSDAARAAFVLHVVDGRPLVEVAEITGTTVVATKVRVWRARREIERIARRDPLLAAYVSQEERA
jgi:RNA polymerase sigma-70 factor (ECF subfamily)